MEPGRRIPDRRVVRGMAAAAVGLLLGCQTDGIDTLYFETEGGASGFPPFTGGEDSVRFGLPLTTSGLAGDTITLRVFGTDRLGNRGDTATRRIAVE